MHPTQSQGPVDPHPALRPIVKPGTPVWMALLTGGRADARSSALGYIALIVGCTLIALLIAAQPLIGAPAVLAVIAAGVAAMLKARQNVVTGPIYELGGQRIRGEVLDLLADIGRRFAYAERKVGEVPTGIDWHEVEPAVQTVMWECALHAAKVSGIDEKLQDLRYAEPGTPQAALRKRVERAREDHLEVMRRFQRDADQLARLAGNAAAAAMVALEVTGSMRELEVITPSVDAQRAATALEEAKARLAMLADVWASLDSSTALLAEKLEAKAAEDDQRRPQPGT